jgi:hypothetical protein
MSYEPDTKVRPLTVGESKINKAWDIYSSLDPVEKLELARRFESVRCIKKKQTACVNYIEDNIKDYI